MKNLIVLLFLYSSAYGQTGLSDSMWIGLDNKDTLIRFIPRYVTKSGLVELDYGQVRYMRKPYRDPDQYPIWVVWSIEDRTSVVFTTPGIHVNGVDLIKWKKGRYKPIPKTRKVITIIK